MGPRKPNTEPRGTSRSSPSTANRAPNRLLSPRVRMADSASPWSAEGTLTRGSPAAHAELARCSSGTGDIEQALERDRTGEDPAVVGEQDRGQRRSQHPARRGVDGVLV
ncbi:hypothetical protein ACFFX0_07575 [Citricoccus parietis]|uniref:Uncharacterized protein n=1 Tax=Citricoccus parietis TaxID=592307 RepID=A0ABV5FWJ0_9MICC